MPPCSLPPPGRLSVAALLVLSVGSSSDGCSLALSRDGPHTQFSGSSALEASEVQRNFCGEVPGHRYVVAQLPPRRRPGAWREGTPEAVGACLPEACVETSSAVVDFLRLLTENRCRDGHPTIRHMWPDEKIEGDMTRFLDWVHRASERLGNSRQLLTRQAVDECASAACTVISLVVIEAPSAESLRMAAEDDVESQVAEALLLMNMCDQKLTSDAQQVKLLSLLGFNLAGVEVALTRLREWENELRPRNPHHDDNRLVWRDHYSGLYGPVNYSLQFDLQWKLALEDPSGRFGIESSVRLDDCALNDMIESTFGEREYLPNCSAAQLAEHRSKERGIARRNYVFLNIEEFRDAKVLDVGCGFGRWSAMMARLGANVTSVDASPHAVRSTRRYNPQQTHQMSLFELESVPGYKEGFDLVICWGVMHHTHDPLAAFRLVAGAVKDGGKLFIQVYSDQSKAAYPFTQSLRRLYREAAEAADHDLDAQVEFLRRTHAAAGADVFDHLDGMLTFYNWVVHEETVKSWFTSSGFEDYWKVWNYKYLGRKRQLQVPVRDDSGRLLTSDLGEAQSGVRYYPAVL